MSTTETYGQQVRRLRKDMRLTQDQLADLSGVPKRTLQDVEGDKRDRPHRATVLALNAALEIEGDPAVERGQWPNDVQIILDILGAYLMTLTPEGRVKWMADVTPQILGR